MNILTVVLLIFAGGLDRRRTDDDHTGRYRKVIWEAPWSAESKDYDDLRRCRPDQWKISSIRPSC